MGFDGYRSEPEARVDHTGLWRPNGSLINGTMQAGLFLWSFGQEKL